MADEVPGEVEAARWICGSTPHSIAAVMPLAAPHAGPTPLGALMVRLSDHEGRH